MKSWAKRKTTQGPCKSPSPDLYSRNIIQDTRIQVGDIRTKMKQAENKQMKFELQSSYSQVAPSDLNTSLQPKYKQMIEQLSKLKNQNKYLSEQNLLLNQENKRFSLHGERNKTISQLTGALLFKTEKEPLREKIGNLDEEKRRLQRELGLQRDKNEQCQRNIEHLRRELLGCHQEIQRLSIKESRGSMLTILMNENENRMTTLSNSIIGSFHETFKAKLDTLNSRINKVELMEKIIKEQQSRLIAESRVHKTPTSFKNQRNDGLSTSGKAEYKSRQDPQSHEKTERSIYPFNSGSSTQAKVLFDESLEKLERENNTLVDLLKSKSGQIYQLKEEKEKAKLSLHDFQQQKMAPKPLTPKFSQKTEKNIFQKMIILEQTAKKYKQELQMSISDKSSINKKLIELSSKNDDEKRQLQSTIDFQKKKITGFKLQLNSSQRYQILIKKDEKISFLSQLNKELTSQLRNVKNMLEYIRCNFQIGEITNILDKNYSLFRSSQQQIHSNQDEYSKGIETFRIQLLVKDEEKAGLEKELDLRGKQIQLLGVELRKVKQLNKQFHKHNQQMRTSFGQASRQTNQQRSSKFKENHSQVLQKLKEGCQRLSILYEKVSNNLYWEVVQRREHDP